MNEKENGTSFLFSSIVKVRVPASSTLPPTLHVASSHEESPRSPVPTIITFSWLLNSWVSPTGLRLSSTPLARATDLILLGKAPWGGAILKGNLPSDLPSKLTSAE